MTSVVKRRRGAVIRVAAVILAALLAAACASDDGSGETATDGASSETRAAVIEWVDGELAHFAGSGAPPMSDDASACMADRLEDRLPPGGFAALPGLTPLEPFGAGDDDVDGQLRHEFLAAAGRCIGPVDHPQREALSGLLETSFTTGDLRYVFDDGLYTPTMADCVADLFLVGDPQGAADFVEIGITEENQWSLAELLLVCGDSEVVDWMMLSERLGDVSKGQFDALASFIEAETPADPVESACIAQVVAEQLQPNFIDQILQGELPIELMGAEESWVLVIVRPANDQHLEVEFCADS